jgi:hypothetical protein
LPTAVERQYRLLLGSLNIEEDLTDDTDFDTVVNVCDNCVATENPAQADTDNDGFGDACDACPNDDQNDVDGDGLCADVDPCPLDPTNTIDYDGSCFNVNGIFLDRFETGDTSRWSAIVQ